MVIFMETGTFNCSLVNNKKYITRGYKSSSNNAKIKNHGSQRYFDKFKRVGMPLLNYGLHTRKNIFGLNKRRINNSLGGSVGNLDKSKNQIWKVKKNRNKDTKLLKKQNKILLKVPKKSTTFSKYLRHIKKIYGGVSSSINISIDRKYSFRSSNTD